MSSIRDLCKYFFVFGSVATVSALPKPQPPTGVIQRRQEAAPSSAEPAPAATSSAAAAGGITDIDILQFALTAEHLEATFYSQGFAKFPASDFEALGLDNASITALQGVGETEAAHVSLLLSAIAGAGVKPVEPCQYNFGFTDAAGMVATARILEAVGVSAYLGAAPLLQDPGILATAATIATIESRHQTFIRSAAGDDPVPAAFDTPLGPRAVFTLASQFITSCPDGSNLNIQAFPSIALSNPGGATSGQALVVADVQSMAAAAAPTTAEGSASMFCAFVGPGINPQFASLDAAGQCIVPQNLAGDVYMLVTNAQNVSDANILAGPSVIQAS